MSPRRKEHLPPPGNTTNRLSHATWKRRQWLAFLLAAIVGTLAACSPAKPDSSVPSPIAKVPPTSPAAGAATYRKGAVQEVNVEPGQLTPPPMPEQLADAIIDAPALPLEQIDNPPPPLVLTLPPPVPASDAATP